MDKTTWPTGIRPRSNGIRIRIWHRGKLFYSETVKGNPYNKTDLRAAVNHRADLERKIKLGIHIDDKAEGEIKLFQDVAQDYLDTLETDRTTHLEYKNILNNFWMPDFEDIPINSITRAKIKKTLATFDVKSKTKRNRLNPLSGVFDYGDIQPNPAFKIKLKAEQKEKIDRYTPSERDLLLSKLSGQFKVYFGILFACGLRPCGEPLALLWSDYDGTNLDISKQITRRKHKASTKTHVRRVVYIPEWMRTIINNHDTRFKAGHIFLNTQGNPHKDSDRFNEAWAKAHTEAKLPYRIPYTCRHTRAAELLSQGVDPAEAAKQLGHSVEMFLRIYSEWIEEYASKRDKSRLEGIAPQTAQKPTKKKLK